MEVKLRKSFAGWSPDGKGLRLQDRGEAFAKVYPLSPQCPRGSFPPGATVEVQFQNGVVAQVRRELLAPELVGELMGTRQLQGGVWVADIDDGTKVIGFPIRDHLIERANATLGKRGTTFLLDASGTITRVKPG